METSGRYVHIVLKLYNQPHLWYCFQVMIVRSEIKKYIGAIEDEKKAAIFYDKYAMIIQGYEVSSVELFSHWSALRCTLFYY